MELTAEQRRIVEHVGGPARVTGGDGYGKTTALTGRYLHLVRRHRASTVLVVCPSQAAADRFRDAVLPHLSGGFDALPVTTWFGLAFDLVRRAGREVRLVRTSEQRAIVRRLLAAESAGDWPLSAAYLGRDAFAAEVAVALLAYQARDPASPPPSGRWAELGAFATHYFAVLDERGQVDRAGLLAAAAAVAAPGVYAHVLVDDHDGSDPSLHRLLAAVAGPDDNATVVSPDRSAVLPWPVVELRLTRAFRRPAEPALVTCRHPSTEPEAVAAELKAAQAQGVAWSEMAVLVRRPQLHGHRVARALGRHGIPVAAGGGFGARSHDPAVAALLDLLRWVAAPDDPTLLERLMGSPLAEVGAGGLAALRDELGALVPTATPAQLAFAVWERALGPVLTVSRRDDPALDAVAALLDRLARHADDQPDARLPDLIVTMDAGGLEPDPWRMSVASAAKSDAVLITSIAAAAGREWHTVVLTGCVEGELPAIRGRAPLFDPALLGGETAPPSPAQRRERSLAAERRIFALACSRATGRLVGTAAPQAGVLLSRFVEEWPSGPARALEPLGPAPAWLEETTPTVEVFPGGRLVLSASQLDTYADCPLRYAYKYGVRTREEPGAPAALGSLVHAVLAEFLDPGRDTDALPRAREALLRLAAERWTDDIALYRPQIEECRRDYFQMLEDWWEVEGEGPGAPEVLAVERRFDIEVGDVRLVGAIDRVDRTADGEGIRIVDYKTGRREPRADAMPDDLQLAVYHLAATRDPLLASFGPPQELRLLYLRSMHAYEQPVVAGHAAVTEARVAATAEDIRSERFEPSVYASCRTCDFHRLCPLQPQGRAVGAR